VWNLHWRTVLGSGNANAAEVKSHPVRSASPLRRRDGLRTAQRPLRRRYRRLAIHARAPQDEDLTLQCRVELGNFHNFEGVDLITDLDVKLAALLGAS
jgi:hypothetical protein